MEKLARIQENMSILKERQAINEASGEKTIKVEIQAIKIGDFVLVTFPAEVSVQVGLNIKKAHLLNSHILSATLMAISITLQHQSNFQVKLTRIQIVFFLQNGRRYMKKKLVAKCSCKSCLTNEIPASACLKMVDCRAPFPCRQ